MCLCCVAEAVTIGEIAPGIWLVQSTKDVEGFPVGYYGIVRSNSPDVVFDASCLCVDIYDGLTDEEIDLIPDETFWEETRKMSKAADNLDEVFPRNPLFGYELVTALKQVGYEDGHVSWFLSDRMARMINKEDA
jgi:hypothetical protein